jgi:hypothetical protein
MMDMPFQRMGYAGGRNISIHDNYVKEAGYTLIRWHGAAEEAGTNYFYNNRVVSIDQVSDFVFLAPDASQAWQPEHSDLRIWFYHNTFSGGNSVWLITDMLSMTGFIAVNNLLANAGLTSNAASKHPRSEEPFGKTIKQWPPEVGPFDYNAMNGVLGAGGSWYGAHNIANMPTAWPTDVIQEECYLPDGHPAKASGIDISRPFVLNGVTYDPLPGFEPGYFEGVAPDRGWIDRGEENGGGEIVPATFTATPNAVVPGATVTVSWTGSTTARDWFALYERGMSHAFDKYHWAYCSSCGATLGTLQPSGSCTIVMPADVGTYEFRLYANDTDTQLAVSNPITVQEAEPEPDEETMLVYVPALLKGGELVPVEDSEVLKRFIGKKKPKS